MDAKYGLLVARVFGPKGQAISEVSMGDTLSRMDAAWRLSRVEDGAAVRKAQALIEYIAKHARRGERAAAAKALADALCLARLAWSAYRTEVAGDLAKAIFVHPGQTIRFDCVEPLLPGPGPTLKAKVIVAVTAIVAVPVKEISVP